MPNKLPKDLFVELSAALTGFTVEELHGTGMVHTYYTKFTDIVGSSISSRLWDTWHQVYVQANGDLMRLEKLIRSQIYDAAMFGPLARNMIGMWYLGNWSQLPATWRSAFGANAADTDHVISSEAYKQGLVWNVIGSHPPGAKQPGYGSWAQPPQPLVAGTISFGGLDADS